MYGGPTKQVDSYVLENMRNRARQAAMRQRDMERNLESARKRAEAAASELRQRSMAGAQEIEREIEAESRKLTSEMESIRTDFGIALGRQNLQLRKELDELRSSISASNKQMDALNAKIDNMAKKFDAELKSVIDRIAGQKDRAQVYLNQFATLLAQIDRLYPDKLAPGRAEQLHEAERFIKANIANADYQAAIGLSQSSIPDAVALIAELERLNAEYLELCVQVQEACLSVSSRFNQLLDAKANEKTVRLGEGNDEREYTYEGDIAFWTSGIFTQLYDAYTKDEEQLLNEFLPQMDMENLRIAAYSIPNYTMRIDSCQKLADNEFSISCAVQNMAVKIYDSLTEDEAWELGESGFEMSDARRSYMESFTDTLGNAIQFVILPGKTQPGAGTSGGVTFSMGAFSPDSSEGMRSILHDAVLSRLASSGLDTRACLSQSTTHLPGDKAGFTAAQYKAGDKIKTRRLDYMRREIVPAGHSIGGSRNE